jgi:hypothetical protein
VRPDGAERGTRATSCCRVTRSSRIGSSYQRKRDTTAVLPHMLFLTMLFTNYQELLRDELQRLFDLNTEGLPCAQPSSAQLKLAGNLAVRGIGVFPELAKLQVSGSSLSRFLGRLIDEQAWTSAAGCVRWCACIVCCPPLTLTMDHQVGGGILWGREARAARAGAEGNSGQPRRREGHVDARGASK